MRINVCNNIILYKLYFTLYDKKANKQRNLLFKVNPFNDVGMRTTFR